MSLTVATDVIDWQILTDTVQGQFAQKQALMGSALTTSGAIAVEGTFPGQGSDVIGQTITVPYFGSLPAFANNADGSSVTPSKLSMGSGTATVTRDSLAFQASRWARASSVSDPYVEMARQAEEQATRAMESRVITAAGASPLLVDLTSLTDDVLTYDALVYAMVEAFGDDWEQAVALACHPLALAGLATQKDSTGNYLLVNPADGRVSTLFGIPLIGSSRLPKTGSAMGTVTSAGTSAPVATLTGTPLDAFKQLKIECQVGGAHETATIRFSTDGGNTWSADLTTAGVDAALALTDTANDSLVGVNGATGLSVAFAAGTFNADNSWTSTPNMTVETQVYLRGAGAFWYNRSALGMQEDKDILNDSSIGAMHLYGVAHVYRRRIGGSRPGVLRIKHKVKGYRG